MRVGVYRSNPLPRNTTSRSITHSLTHAPTNEIPSNPHHQMYNPQLCLAAYRVIRPPAFLLPTLHLGFSFLFLRWLSAISKSQNRVWGSCVSFARQWDPEQLIKYQTSDRNLQESPPPTHRDRKRFKINQSPAHIPPRFHRDWPSRLHVRSEILRF